MFLPLEVIASCCYSNIECGRSIKRLYKDGERKICNIKFCKKMLTFLRVFLHFSYDLATKGIKAMEASIKMRKALSGVLGTNVLHVLAVRSA